MNDSSEERNGELIDKLIEGVASDEELARAHELIASDPTALRRYVEHINLVSALEQEKSGIGATSVPELISPGRPSRRRVVTAATAATLVAGIVVLWFLPAMTVRMVPQVAGRDASSALPSRQAATARSIDADSPLARLVAGDAPRFEGVRQPVNGVFEAGDYELVAGAISLRFNNGVELTVESPANFELVHGKRVVLHWGRARARVPQAGIGFVIAAPGVDIEDLGTEFGVLVEKDRTTALRVFTGVVELHRKGHSPLQLNEDSTTLLKDGQALTSPVDGELDFPTTSQVAYQQWRAFSESLRNDRSAVVYYDFEPDPLQPGVLKDRSGGAQPVDGLVRGALWTSGRWSQKPALFFDRDGDCVEVDIPGEFDAFTLHTWIRVNRLEFPKQSIFGVHGWDRPGVHKLDLHNTGELAFAVRGNSPEFRVHRTPVGTISVGGWTHLAAVVDRKAQVATYYKDGRQVLSVPVSGDFPLIFGPSIIGGFEHRRSSLWPYHLQFRGWIDELAVFGRALSPEDVGEIYEQGRCFD